MTRRTRSYAIPAALILAAVAVTGPAGGQPSSASPQTRLREVANLYGDHGAATARLVGTRRIGSAARVLGVALPGPSRPVLVFVLAGRTPPAPSPPGAAPPDGPQGDAVLSGALDVRTGDVLAVRRTHRPPDLAPLGPVHTVRLSGAGGPGSPPQAVGGITFDTVLTRLLAAGYRVAVPRFPTPRSSPPNVARLRDLLVDEALPVGRMTVKLRLRFIIAPQGSPAIPAQRPGGVAVPSLVGMSYATALGALPPGLYLRLEGIGPLRAAASVRGLDAFVVNAQAPAAGTLLPAYGVPIPHGVNLGPSMVTVRLAARGPGP